MTLINKQSIREMFSGLRVKSVKELDDRHFEINHNPDDEVKVLLTIRQNGYRRVNYDNGITVIGCY